MIELGLSRILSLLTHSPTFFTPSSTWKAVHITGTNGKGSIAAYASSLFTQSGLKVGRFTSPHLMYRHDCITINQSPISESQFLDIEKQIKARNIEKGTNATEFEVLTATAFEVFDVEGIDVGVVECGLGGARDATNVLPADKVLVSIVAKVGLDHVDFLGGTVEEIAWEKSGIFKEGVPVVVDGSNLQSVVDVFKKRIQSGRAGQMTLAHPTDLQEIESNQNPDRLRNLPLHQQQNLAVAVQAFRQAIVKLRHYTNPNLNREGGDSPSNKSETSSSPISDTKHGLDLDRTIAQVQSEWKGRLQLLSITSIAPGRRKQDVVLLDGAHNTQSAEVLRDYICQRLRSSRASETNSSNPTSNISSSNTKKPSPVTFLLALKSDKTPSSILPLLLESGDSVVTCPFSSVDGMPWVKPLPPQKLADLARDVLMIMQKNSGEHQMQHRDLDPNNSSSKANGPAETAETTNPSDTSKTDSELESAVKVVATDSVQEGILKAVEIADGGPLVIAGSLYLVGDVLRLIDTAEKSGIGMEAGKND